MIDKLKSLAVVSLMFAALPVGAAHVWPDSAAGYIFSTPLYPGKISGVVMGSPPEYFTPRSEDADWLSEAIAERMALRNGHLPDPNTVLYPEFGIWELSETNRFYRWETAVDADGVTNVVVGFHLVTNTPPIGNTSKYVGTDYLSLVSRIFYVISFGRFLDGDEPLSSTPRVAFDWTGASSLTNVTYSYLATNIVTNAFSTIEMPMTNGTVSVHTNAWNFTALEYVPIAVTSVVQASFVDYCHPGDKPFPAFTNFPERTLFSTPYAQPVVIGAMYETLNGLVRLHDSADTTNYSSVISWDSIDGYWTNSVESSALYRFSWSCQKSYSWNSETHTYDETLIDYASETRTPAYVAIAPTRFDSLLVTTGGAERVEIQAAFAVVEFEYRFERQTGDIPNLRFETLTNLHKAVIAPLASPVLDTSETVALARVSLDARSLCVAAATAVGVDTPPSPGQYQTTPGDAARWETKCSKIVLIYKLNPSSKFILLE